VEPDGTAEDLRADAGPSQRRDLQGAGPPMAAPQQGRQAAVHHRGREAPEAAHDRVSQLQVQAPEEADAIPGIAEAESGRRQLRS